MGDHGSKNDMIKQDQTGEAKQLLQREHKIEKRGRENGITGLVQGSRDQ